MFSPLHRSSLTVICIRVLPDIIDGSSFKLLQNRSMDILTVDDGESDNNTLVFQRATQW